MIAARQLACPTYWANNVKVYLPAKMIEGVLGGLDGRQGWGQALGLGCASEEPSHWTTWWIGSLCCQKSFGWCVVKHICSYISQ